MLTPSKIVSEAAVSTTVRFLPNCITPTYPRAVGWLSHYRVNFPAWFQKSTSRSASSCEITRHLLYSRPLRLTATFILLHYNKEVRENLRSLACSVVIHRSVKNTPQKCIGAPGNGSELFQCRTKQGGHELCSCCLAGHNTHKDHLGRISAYLFATMPAENPRKNRTECFVVPAQKCSAELGMGRITFFLSQEFEQHLGTITSAKYFGIRHNI